MALFGRLDFVLQFPLPRNVYRIVGDYDNLVTDIDHVDERTVDRQHLLGRIIGKMIKLMSVTKHFWKISYLINLI